MLLGTQPNYPSSHGYQPPITPLSGSIRCDLLGRVGALVGFSVGAEEGKVLNKYPDGMTVADLKRELEAYPEYYPVVFYGLPVNSVGEEVNERPKDDPDNYRFEAALHSEEWGNFCAEIRKRAKNDD